MLFMLMRILSKVTDHSNKKQKMRHAFILNALLQDYLTKENSAEYTNIAANFAW